MYCYLCLVVLYHEIETIQDSALSVSNLDQASLNELLKVLSAIFFTNDLHIRGLRHYFHGYFKISYHVIWIHYNKIDVRIINYTCLHKWLVYSAELLLKVFTYSDTFKNEWTRTKLKYWSLFRMPMMVEVLKNNEWICELTEATRLLSDNSLLSRL